MSSFLSRFFKFRCRGTSSKPPTIHVCGLLGTTSVAVAKDKWIATEWVAIWRHLLVLGARNNLSTWLCGMSIHNAGNFLLGCNRIEFNLPPFQEICHKDGPTGLRAKYIGEVAKASSRLSTGDVLILVLVGHGNDTGAFIIGDDNVYCELRKEELEAVVRGTSGEVRLINTSCFSGSWESPCWKLRAAAIRSTTADVRFIPRPQNNHASYTAASAIRSQEADQVQQTKLSPLDEDDLFTRAKKLLQSNPFHTAPETSTILQCWTVVHGPDRGRTLDNAKKHRLLLQLRNREIFCTRASILVNALGWNKAAEEIGTVQGTQPMSSLRTQAEASGCFVNLFTIQETPRRLWVHVAVWLARVWECSGSQVVEKHTWDLAFEQSLRVVD